jgi:hypothetical protein
MRHTQRQQSRTLTICMLCISSPHAAGSEAALYYESSTRSVGLIQQGSGNGDIWTTPNPDTPESWTEVGSLPPGQISQWHAETPC